MKATEANLLGILKGPKQFVIPIYQRSYSWQIDECSQLLDDILRISNSEKINTHFVGSIVYFQPNIHTTTDVPEYLVIDGQQRITTLTLLLIAIANFLNENNVSIGTTSDRLINYYLLNNQEDGDLRYKIILNKKDKEVLIGLLRTNNPQMDGNNAILINYKYFKSELNIENIEDVYTGLQKLSVVDVALEKDIDNPQLIFESLNSTGLDLSPADLIRNFVLMGLSQKQQIELYENYWFPMEKLFGNEYTSYFDGFMRYYLTIKSNELPNIDKVYYSFKQYLKKNNNISIKNIVADLLKYANYFVRIALNKEEDKFLLQIFKDINKLKVDTSYPLLLTLYNDYAEKNIEKEVLIECAKLIESYVFRRAICGIPTNSLNKTFASIYKLIDKSNYINSYGAIFLMLDSYRRFPDDNEFKNELVLKDVYNFRSRNYLLSKLENINRKEKVKIEEYTIEHIMPQNENLSPEWQKDLGEHWKEIQEKYLHTLGNLTVTAYNPELSDKPFKIKKSIEGGYDKSPLKLNDTVRCYDVWNENSILTRVSKLSEFACDIWHYPKVDIKYLEEIKKNNEKHSIYELNDYEFMKDSNFEIFELLRKRIINLSSNIKVEYTKKYIAFKLITNIVDIVPLKSGLKLFLNMRFTDIIDPKNICSDVSDVGKTGNGDIAVMLTDRDNLDYVIELIEQSLNKQIDEV